MQIAKIQKAKEKVGDIQYEIIASIKGQQVNIKQED